MKTLALLAASLVLTLSGFVDLARAAAPSVTTTNPTSITTNSATLNGSANPNSLATIAYFEWGTTTNYGFTTAAQDIGAGAAPVPVQANLSSLLTDTNYHCRLVASNASGVAYGSDVIVTPTLRLYLYAGESWTYAFHDLPYGGTTFYNVYLSFIRSTFQILPGSFPPGASVQFQLFYVSTNDPPSVTKVVNSPATEGTLSQGPWGRSGLLRLTVLTGSVAVTSIATRQTDYPIGGGIAPYYQNTIVPTKFPQPPSLATQFVHSVSLVSAGISVDLNGNNLPTGVFVEWGPTTNYGSASSVTNLDVDYFVRRDFTISNLAPGTVYQARVVATNTAGTTYGNNLTFKALAPATVVTLPANNRKTTSATLNGLADISGLATTAYFEWGATTNYDQVTPLQNLGSPVVVTNVSAPLAGLAPQTTYHCRAVVYSVGVTNFGDDVAFSTTPPPTNLVVTNLATDDVRGAIERGGSVVFACDGVLMLTNQIEIANDVVLDANGHAITFSGNNLTRIFSVLPGTTLLLSNVTMANGRSTNTAGAIYNEGTVLAQACRFLNNLAVGTSGVNGTNGANGVNGPSYAAGQPGSAGTAAGGAAGGAIFSSGTVNLWRCFFASNSVVGGAGGNGGRGGQGGRQSIGSGPGAPGGRGADGSLGGGAQGGSIASLGTLLLDGCAFSHSVANGGIGGDGGIGGLHGAVFSYNGSGNGGAPGLSQGGAVFAAGLTWMSNSLFAGNSCSGGNAGNGGITLAMALSTNGGAASGGAIYFVGNGLIANSTFSANLATGGNAGLSYYGYDKGGDAFGGALASVGNLLTANVTLDRNAALGGLPFYSFSFKGNSLGGSIANTGGVFQIVNSILSGGTSNNAFGTITDLGHNLSSDATPVWTSGTSLNNTDPLLLPLANYGGPTLTMPLHAGSPALNNGDCALAPATDQRGYPRPDGPGCDIGATEGATVPSLQIFRYNPAPHLLRWTALAGRTYRVDAAISLNAWSPYATNVAATNGPLELPVPVSAPERFFRLQAE